MIHATNAQSVTRICGDNPVGLDNDAANTIVHCTDDRGLGGVYKPFGTHMLGVACLAMGCALGLPELSVK